MLLSWSSMAKLILATAEGQQAIELRGTNSSGRHPNDNTIQLLDKIVSERALRRRAARRALGAAGPRKPQRHVRQRRTRWAAKPPQARRRNRPRLDTSPIRRRLGNGGFRCHPVAPGAVQHGGSPLAPAPWPGPRLYLRARRRRQPPCRRRSRRLPRSLSRGNRRRLTATQASCLPPVRRLLPRRQQSTAEPRREHASIRSRRSSRHWHANRRTDQRIFAIRCGGA